MSDFQYFQFNTQILKILVQQGGGANLRASLLPLVQLVLIFLIKYIGI